MSMVPLNITLPPVSGGWIYSPRRIESTWSASFTLGTPRSDGSGDGAMYVKTRFAQSTISYNFTGTQLLLCVALNGTQSQLMVDGEVTPAEQSNDPACLSLGATHTLSSGIFSQDGPHIVELQLVSASAEQELWFFGGVAMMDVEVGSTPGVTLNELKIDDRDRNWILHPGSAPQENAVQWVYESLTARAFMGTRAINCVYIDNTLATYQFSGASVVVLYGYLDATTRYYSIVFDGEMHKADASTIRWRVGTTPLFVRTGLDPSKSYSIAYSNYNEDEPLCPRDYACCASLDMLHLFGPSTTLTRGLPVGVANQTNSTTSSITFTLEQSPESTLPSSKGSAPSVVIIAGAVFGAVLGLCALIIIGFWYWRCNRVRRRRLGRHELNIDATGDLRKADLAAAAGWNPQTTVGQTVGYPYPAAVSGCSSRPEKGWAVKPLQTREVDVPSDDSRSGIQQLEAPPSSPTANSTALSADVDRLMRLVAVRLGISSRPAGNGTRPPSYLTEQRTEGLL